MILRHLTHRLALLGTAGALAFLPVSSSWAQSTVTTANGQDIHIHIHMPPAASAPAPAAHSGYGQGPHVRGDRGQRRGWGEGRDRDEDIRRQDWTDRARVMRGMMNSMNDEDLGRWMQGMYEQWGRDGHRGGHHGGHGHGSHGGSTHGMQGMGNMRGGFGGPMGHRYGAQQGDQDSDRREQGGQDRAERGWRGMMGRHHGHGGHHGSRHAQGHGQHRDHRAGGQRGGNGAGMTTPREMGSGLYTTLAELVYLLEKDDRTDWSKVDLTRVRNEVLALDLILSEAEVAQENTEEGVILTVTGSEAVMDAARPTLGTLSAELAQATGWTSTSDVVEDSIVWTVSDPQKQVVDRIQGLGFYGLVVSAQDRRELNWGIARGDSD